MSGHSKWSKIKHQKKVTDKAKGKIFSKLGNAITVAVKQGGGQVEPEKNFHLRLAIDKAKSENMPKENIRRAIDRAVNPGKGEAIEELTYEGFGPYGVGILIEAASNNKQRTVSKIKQILDRGGGTLAEGGSVSHLFDRVGMIEVAKNDKTSDEVLEIALDAGASDLEDGGDYVIIYTDYKNLHSVKEKVQKDLTVTDFGLVYKPRTEVNIDSKDKADKIISLVEKLEDEEDVQKVHANLDIPEEYFQ